MNIFLSWNSAFFHTNVCTAPRIGRTNNKHSWSFDLNSFSIEQITNKRFLATTVLFWATEKIIIISKVPVHYTHSRNGLQYGVLWSLPPFEYVRSSNIFFILNTQFPFSIHFTLVFHSSFTVLPFKFVHCLHNIVLRPGLNKYIYIFAKKVPSKVQFMNMKEHQDVKKHQKVLFTRTQYTNGQAG